MSYQVITPVAASAEPLPLQEVKQFLRIDYTDEDFLLQMMISEAREYCENVTRCSLAPQTLQAMLRIDLLPAGPVSGPIGFRQSMLELPMPPVNSVTLLEAETSPGQFQTVATANYVVDTAQFPARIYLLASAYSFLGSQWTLWIGPYNPRFRVTYTAGYTRLPMALRRALLEMVGFLYAYREGRDEAQGGRYASKSSIPAGIAEKLEQFKVYYLA